MTATTPDRRLIQYAQAIEADDGSYYSRYLADIDRLMPDGGSFLDVGCGTGRVLRDLWRSRPDAMFAGVEPCDYFRRLAKRTGVPIFADCSHVVGRFDVVGSFTVLEHCKLPGLHLIDCAKLVRPGGHLIVACPNMLSPWNTAMGLSLSEKLEILRGHICGEGFRHVPERISEPFKPDDDAVTVTHELPIRGTLTDWRVVKAAGTMRPDLFADLLAMIPAARWLMPSTYLVFGRKA